MVKIVFKNYKKNQFQRKTSAVTMINISWILAVSSHLLMGIDRWLAVICSAAQVLSCEYYEIFKNTYFEEHLRTAASTLLIRPLLNEKHNMEWFLLRRFDIWSEYIFCWLLVETIPTGQDIILISRFWQIYAGGCPYVMSILMICK